MRFLLVLLIYLGGSLSLLAQTKKGATTKTSVSNDAISEFGMYPTPYELGEYQQTSTYFETIKWYKNIQKNYSSYTQLFEIGGSDAGLPIYCFKISNPNLGLKKSAENRIKVLINNNIHPGEPEGTDASMLLVRDILTDPHRFRKMLSVLDVYVILQYNVDGTLNRNSSSRANQDGPAEYGFRGNGKNLDLNRDFIKMDSRNAQSLVSFMSDKKFDYFIDNHTSNGADYQYTLTYFHTRPEKLPHYLVPTMLKLDTVLKQSLLNAGWPTSPYVNTLQEVPDSGLVGFYESPRFATGWASLMHTIGFTVETHMLKPFHNRVDATRDFLEVFLNSVSQDRIVKQLQTDKLKFKLSSEIKTKVFTNYTLNEKHFEWMDFLGYEHGYKPSGVSGLSRLFYDRNKPKTIKLKYYNQYIPTDSVNMPFAYVIPVAYKEIIDRLNWNHVGMKTIQHDTIVSCSVSYIVDYKTVKDPYEGHYLHSQVKTRDTVLKMSLKAGDKIILVNSMNADFLSATLEPKSPDSYFCWNFFDGILQQKEGYSAYVFEDRAVEILSKNHNLKSQLYEKQKMDPSFAQNAGAQLDWVYKHSEYYEPSHKRYPIYRIMWK